MIVIVIRGGTLQEVYDVPPCSEQFTSNEVWLVDWDDIDCGDTAGLIPRNITDTLPPEIAAQIPGWISGPS